MLDTALPRAGQDADLATLADRIRERHRQVGTGLSYVLDLAMDAGEALIVAKTKIAHGGWDSWLRRQCDLPVRTAERYMQLARNRALLKSNPSRTTDLSIAGALRLISQTAPKKAAKRTAAPATLSSMAFMQASPAERTAFLNAIGLTAILAALPPSFRIEIQRRVAGRGAASEFDQFEAPKTATNALRKALSLEKIARLPGISPAMANANKTEALAALKWITDLVDLNDLVLMITEAAVAKRCRRAA